MTDLIELVLYLMDRIHCAFTPLRRTEFLDCEKIFIRTP